MKKSIILSIALTTALSVNAQTLKIQGGTAISKLDWQLDRINSTTSLYDQNLIGHSIFAGIDYARIADYVGREYFNLSSNIGMLRKGGKHEILFSDENGLTGETLMDKLTLDYLSINTTIDLKLPIGETIFPFVSFGPRFDYVLSHSKHFDMLQEMDELKKFSTGLILGGGIKFNIGESLQIGLRADYYYNFNDIADWRTRNTGNGGKISVNTFTIGLSVGYRFYSGWDDWADSVSGGF